MVFVCESVLSGGGVWPCEVTLYLQLHFSLIASSFTHGSSTKQIDCSRYRVETLKAVKRWENSQRASKLTILCYRNDVRKGGKKITVKTLLWVYFSSDLVVSVKGKEKKKGKQGESWTVWCGVAWRFHYTIDDKEWFCCLAADRRIISPARTQEGEQSRQGAVIAGSPQGRECWAPINYRVQSWNIRLNHCLEAGGTVPLLPVLLLSALRWLGGI